MRFREFSIIEADGPENINPDDEAQDTAAARELSRAVNNPDASAPANLPNQGGVSFANDMLRGLFGAIFSTAFRQMGTAQPAFANILQLILSGQSGGFDPRAILNAAPPQFRGTAERVMSQFDRRTGRPTDVPTEMGTSSGRINYENRGGVRNLRLSSRLEDILRRTAEEVRLDVFIVSGGQMSMDAYQRAPGRKTNSGGSSPTYFLNGRPVRKGSTRHDNGNAADLYLKDGGTMIRLNDPKMNAFVEAFFRNGGQGGSGDFDYMGPNTIHLDVIGTSHGGSVFWNATPQFMAAANRGLATQGTATATA